MKHAYNDPCPNRDENYDCACQMPWYQAVDQAIAELLAENLHPTMTLINRRAGQLRGEERRVLNRINGRELRILREKHGVRTMNSCPSRTHTNHRHVAYSWRDDAPNLFPPRQPLRLVVRLRLNGVVNVERELPIDVHITALNQFRIASAKFEERDPSTGNPGDTFYIQWNLELEKRA